MKFKGVAVALLAVACLMGCRGEEKMNLQPSANAVTTATGLKYEEIKEGTGSVAQPGQEATVHYTGWLQDGTKFDSSLDRNSPFQFKLGARQVIRGWDEGVAGMKVGGVRKLYIPPELGYGAQGVPGAIPPGATLVFEVELLGVR